MRANTAYILFLIYFCASIKVFLPFMQDCFAHTFFLKSHLEQVHGGQQNENHSHDEFVKLVNDQSNTPIDEQVPPALDKLNLTSHFSSLLTFKLFNREQLLVGFPFFILFVNNRIWLEIIGPPPK